MVLLALYRRAGGLTVWQGMRKKADTLGCEVEQELAAHAMPIRKAVIWQVVGLVLLIASFPLLVWGAVEIAEGSVSAT